MTDFHRIKRLPPYVFEEVNRAKAKARGRRRRHRRSRHGQPGPRRPRRTSSRSSCETAGKPRTDRYSASKGIGGPAPRPGRLLRPPLRREAQPRHAGRGDARLEGGLRQHGAGHHGAGRRGARAEPVLPDPRLRLPDGGRRRSAPSRPSRRRPSSRRSSARCMHSIPKPIAVVVCYPSNPTAYVAVARFLPRPRRLREEARALRPVRPRLCGGLFRRASRRPPCCRCRARWT